jgi:hypothetical protein
MRRRRRCTTRPPLWGKNAAMKVGFLLQFLFKTLTRPLASFSFHGQFDFTQ